MDSAQSRVIAVSAARLPRWLDGFRERHGDLEISVAPEAVELRAPDRAEARIALPWGPLPGEAEPLDELIAAVAQERRIGGLIVHRRAHAVGVFDGSQLTSGRHDSHYVQARTKAGGWSQQRYARRRANQADKAYASAMADCEAVLLTASGLEGLATGGDQAAVTAILADRAMTRLRELPRLMVPAVPDPNAGILADFGERLRQVRITLNGYA